MLRGKDGVAGEGGTEEGEIEGGETWELVGDAHVEEITKVRRPSPTLVSFLTSETFPARRLMLGIAMWAEQGHARRGPRLHRSTPLQNPLCESSISYSSDPVRTRTSANVHVT